MAYVKPRAIDIEIVDAETGHACERAIQMHFLEVRWEAARYLESLGITDLLDSNQKQEAAKILSELPVSEHQKYKLRLSGYES